MYNIVIALIQGQRKTLSLRLYLTVLHAICFRFWAAIGACTTDLVVLPPVPPTLTYHVQVHVHVCTVHVVRMEIVQNCKSTI